MQMIQKHQTAIQIEKQGSDYSGQKTGFCKVDEIILCLR